MPNMATFLKAEISRIACKEVRADTASLKKTSSAHCTEIDALKKRIQVLEQQLRRLGKVGVKVAPVAVPDVAATPIRFTAKALQAMRRRLDLRCVAWAF